MGFREITTALREAARASTNRCQPFESVALGYLAFARDHPALYEAMFTLPTDLLFAEVETKSELKNAFEALAAVASPSSPDVDVATETLWAALHGLAELERSGRIKHSTRADRVALMVHGLSGV